MPDTRDVRTSRNAGASGSTPATKSGTTPASGQRPIGLSILQSISWSSRGVNCALLAAFVCVAHACMFSTAVAQPNVPLLPPVQATGGTVARIPADRAADAVNVKDFGAKGDDVTDDTAALNAAMAYVRTHRSVGNGQPGITGQAYTASVIIPQGRYKVTSSLNWTNLVSLTVEIDCQGCVIDGQTNGTPVIDALGSRWLHVNGLTVWGSDTATPSIGLQIGRTSRMSAGGHDLKDLTLAGSFSFAALYDFAAETTAFNHLLVWNHSPLVSAFGIVLDGINHWHAASVFTKATAPVDRLQSFNEALFVNPSIMTTNGAKAPIWMAGTSRARFVTGYVANTYAACGTVLYATGAWPIIQLRMDVHYENHALQDVFCIDGPAGTRQASIRGLHYTDNYPEAANSLFKVSANVASVTMRDSEIRVDNFYAASAKVFDDPTLWTVSGRYAEISGNHWNLPSSQFQGSTDLAGRVTVTGTLQATPATPASSSAVCTVGQITAGTNYIYVCIATNTWKRSALMSW